MITRKIKMSEIEEKGFNALINDKDNHVKILVDIAASVAEVAEGHDSRAERILRLLPDQVQNQQYSIGPAVGTE
jgi:hypothetical protein